MKTKHTVGFIGLGLMGGAIAEQYLRAGGTPNVFALSETLVDKLVAQGAQRALSPRAIGDKARVVDRKSGVAGKRVSVRVDLGGPRIIHTTTHCENTTTRQ